MNRMDNLEDYVAAQNKEANSIARACTFLADGDIAGAGTVIKDEYPFLYAPPGARKYTERNLTDTFLRDGGIDRYMGHRLIYTPVLRILSGRLGEIVPYQKNWKMDSTHQAYWNLAPTLDHIASVAGGWQGKPDASDNWVCCSQLTNSQKGAWTLEQLGWTLKPVGDDPHWDGLVTWFLTYYPKHEDLHAIDYFRSWYRVAQAAVNARGLHISTP